MSLSRFALFLIPALVAAISLAGCDDSIIGLDDDDVVVDDDDDDDDDDQQPLFDQLLGTIDYEMSYTDGELDGDECTETYDLTTVDSADEDELFDALQEDCSGCETLYRGTFDLIDEDACVGGPELAEHNYIALDLITEPGWAIFWWGGAGGTNWTELESGEIDFDEVVIVVTDQGGGSTNEAPCEGWGNSCDFDAVYVNYFDLGSTDRPDDD